MYKAIIRRRGTNKLETLATDAPCLRCALIVHTDKTWSPATDLSLRISINTAKEVDLGRTPSEDVEVLMVYNAATNEGEAAMIQFVQAFGRKEIEVKEMLRGLAARDRTPPLVTASGWPR